MGVLYRYMIIQILTPLQNLCWFVIRLLLIFCFLFRSSSIESKFKETKMKKMKVKKKNMELFESSALILSSYLIPLLLQTPKISVSSKVNRQHNGSFLCSNLPFWASSTQPFILQYYHLLSSKTEDHQQWIMITVKSYRGEQHPNYGVRILILP